jgi:hypothetical protein
MSDSHHFYHSFLFMYVFWVRSSLARKRRRVVHRSDCKQGPPFTYIGKGNLQALVVIYSLAIQLPYPVIVFLPVVIPQA